MDLEQARFNMIEQQIRPWNVLDGAVLAALSAVPREAFVPDEYRALAFMDLEIPLPHDQVMLAPKLEARLLQELQLKPTDRVLEIGTGSGYFTALLARFAAVVTSVEIHPDLKAQAEARLAAQGIKNIRLMVGNGAEGWPTGAPYDVIVVTASLPMVPEALKKQLAPGGRLLAMVGDAPVMSALRVVRVAPETFTQVRLFETCTRPLQHARQPERFVF